MTWQSVGTHSFVPTDKAVQVGSFDLAAGQDTIWVRITQLNDPGDWPWSYGILSWQNANGTPLGSIKAYSNRLGEVFRLGNGLAPLDGVGSIWFEPRGYNLGWLKAGFPWELQFEAQAGASDLTSGYWNRDPVNAVLTPRTPGDDVDLGTGDLSAAAGTFSGNILSGDGATASRHFNTNVNFSFPNSTAIDGIYVIRNATNNFSGIVSSRLTSNGGADFTSAVSIGGDWANDNPNIALNADGSARFVGNVVAPNITFRSATPALMGDVDYAGPELDLLSELVRLEALVKHLYETLRLAPPAGWEVWDGNTDLVQSRGKKRRHI